MTKLNWEKANKQQIVRERGSVSSKSTPKKKKKKPVNKRYKDMESKFKSKCPCCRRDIKVGDSIRYYYESKVALHKTCLPNKGA